MPQMTQMLLAVVVLCSVPNVLSFSIRDFVKLGGKRGDAESKSPCPTWHPFECPSGECVPIKYLCDGSPDCSDEYDENKSMCTAATRPPVEETAAFLKALMHAHGKEFLVKVFGEKARNELASMGGVDKVAVALSQSPTADVFGMEFGFSPEETENMMMVLDGILNSNSAELTANERHIREIGEMTFSFFLFPSEDLLNIDSLGVGWWTAADFRFFVQKLQETGFF